MKKRKLYFINFISNRSLFISYFYVAYSFQIVRFFVCSIPRTDKNKLRWKKVWKKNKEWWKEIALYLGKLALLGNVYFTVNIRIGFPLCKQKHNKHTYINIIHKYNVILISQNHSMYEMNTRFPIKWNIFHTAIYSVRLRDILVFIICIDER